MRLPALFRRRSLWFAAFLTWALVLWRLSNGPLPGPEGPHLPGLDKVMHFGYFFGGSILLSGALFLGRTTPPNWTAAILLVVVVVAAIGVLDEWHQSWIPHRSGNDLGDWLADLCGALAGALLFRVIHPFLALPSEGKPAPQKQA